MDIICVIFYFEHGRRCSGNCKCRKSCCRAMKACWGCRWAIIRAWEEVHTVPRVLAGRNHCFCISCYSFPISSLGRAGHGELSMKLLQWNSSAKASCLKNLQKSCCSCLDWVRKGSHKQLCWHVREREGMVIKGILLAVVQLESEDDICP